MNEEDKKRVDAVVGVSRLAGGALILIGSILVYFFATAALDPNGVIEINGVPTKDQTSKIMVLIFACLFPILGLFLAFAPNRLMDKLAAKVITWFG